MSSDLTLRETTVQLLNWVFGWEDPLMSVYYAAIAFALAVSYLANLGNIANIFIGLFLGILIGRATAIDSES